MAYTNLAQSDHDALSEPELPQDVSWSPSPPQHGKPWAFQPLSLDFENLGESSRLRERSQGPPPTRTDPEHVLSKSDEKGESRDKVSRRSDEDEPHSAVYQASPTLEEFQSPIIEEPRLSISVPKARPAESEKVESPLQHPAPDLQSLQGAYIKNVERLERSAESMGSNVDVEVKKLREEQKRSDSRRSSMLSNAVESESRPVSRHPSSSYHNSIVGVNSAARSGGYSPAGMTLSRGSSFSQSNRLRPMGTRLASFPEPHLEGRPLDSFTSAPASNPTNTSNPPIPPVHRSFSYDESPPGYDLSHGSEIPNQSQEPAESRQANLTAPEQGAGSSPSASLDIHNQANALFKDFDGVHFDNQDDRSNTSQSQEVRNSMLNPPRARPQSHFGPPQDGMVYYPAPVPRTLNLPQRLSKQPTAAEREKRRSQILSTIPLEARPQSYLMPNLDETEAVGEHYQEQQAASSNGDTRRNTKQFRNSVVPAQLRASAYFEKPAPVREVEVRHESAVATLDSILDASADAPVGAFTDHPIVGQIGSEVYKKEMAKRLGKDHPVYGNQVKRQSSLLQMQIVKKSSALRLAEYEAEGDDDDYPRLRGASGSRAESGRSAENEDEDENDKALVGNEDDLEEDDFDDPQYHGAPTTLLAELQMRKEQQKSRTRSAATAFPGGMHSTLLELDAVAQQQKNTRRKRRTALAWEDPQEHAQSDAEAEDDEVPLGILYPGRDGDGNVATRRLDDQLPIGLVEKRALEDNEPLSSRRSRLLGIPVQPINTNSSQRASSVLGLEVPGTRNSPGAISDNEDETLAQRRARLKTNGAPSIGLGDRRQSSTFTDDVLSQFGGGLTSTKEKQVERTDSPAEETLGQRRKRLIQEDAALRLTGGVPLNQPPVRTQRSMADGPQAPFAAQTAQYQYGTAAMPNQSMQFGHLTQVPNMNGYGIMPSNPMFANRVNSQQYGLQSQMGGMYNNNSYRPGFPPAGPGMGHIAPQQRSISYTGPVMGFNNPSLAAAFPRQNPYLLGGTPREGSLMMIDDGPPLDPRQRDMIDNWRRSVMH